MKLYWELTKQRVKDFVTSNWQSERLFDKGKIIAIGLVIFFLLWKLIYNIFV